MGGCSVLTRFAEFVAFAISLRMGRLARVSQGVKILAIQLLQLPPVALKY